MELGLELELRVRSENMEKSRVYGVLCFCLSSPRLMLSYLFIFLFLLQFLIWFSAAAMSYLSRHE